MSAGRCCFFWVLGDSEKVQNSHLPRNPRVQAAPPEDGDDQQRLQPRKAVIAARHLWNWRRRVHSKIALQQLCREAGCTSSWATQLLACAAECSARAQRENLNHVVDYVARMSRGGHLRPVAFCLRSAYDETPIQVKVGFASLTDEVTELSKVYVVEMSWSLLVCTTVEPNPHRDAFLLIQGAFSPTIRASDTNRGESVACILRDAWQGNIGCMAAIEETFPLHIHVTESDEAPANLRGERLLSNTCLPTWTSLPLRCSLHKLHSTCEKVFQLCPLVLTGSIRVLLVLQSTSNMQRLKSKLRELIEGKFEFIVGPRELSHEALEYRKWVLTTWMPGKEQSRKLATLLTLSACLLNGDWRGDRIQHICHSCCQSRNDCLAKVQVHMAKLLDVLRMAALCKANWASWSRPLSLLGVFCSMNAILPALFRRAFGNEVSWEGGEHGKRKLCQSGTFALPR